MPRTKAAYPPEFRREAVRLVRVSKEEHPIPRIAQEIGVSDGTIHEPHKEFKTRALLWTGLKADPDKIVACFAMRWQLEVIFLTYGGISGSRRRGSGRR